MVQSCAWQSLRSAVAEHPDNLPIIDDYQQPICQVLEASSWCLQKWLANPAMLTPAWYAQSYDRARFKQELTAQLQQSTDIPSLHKQLRLFRTQHQLRFIWRNTLKLCSAQSLTQELSDFADICIDSALSWLYEDAVKHYGEPQNSQGQVQKMVVLGMGKLGGGELNLSSDIDLIFAFPEAGATVGKAKSNRVESNASIKSIDNQLFFIRLGQSLIQALDQQTADGFVFRVDMRLRPYGDSGALVLNFNGMERYYQDQGREWERYAFIKARVVAGDQQAGQALIKLLQPFIYRRYIDFSAIDALRRLKQLIANEVRRRDLEDNIKLGSGGIREVEFIGQTFQLIHGGKDARLQTPRLMTVLQLLPQLTDWPPAVIKQLQEDYWFLRDIEHALQSVGDLQTQQLPNTKEEQGRLVSTMAYKNWATLAADIQTCRQRIHHLFAEVIRVEETPTNDTQTHLEQILIALCSQLSIHAQEPIDLDSWQQALQEAGFDEPKMVLQHLLNLYQSRTAASMQTIAEQRLLKVLPTLLLLASQQAHTAQVVARVLVLIEAVLRRSVYLVLLQESPPTMKLLVELCAASPWFGDFLARQPALLDELLDVNTLLSASTANDLHNDLQQRLLRVPSEDSEQIIEVLTHFKHAHFLRAAAQQVTKKLPLMQVSDLLTYTAETVLKQVLWQAWQELSERYGYPSNSQDMPLPVDAGQLALPNNFIIVGYGKVGGWELNFASDLDLVFIFNAPHDAMTDAVPAGSKSIPNSLFFTRLGQRIISYLNTMTAAGQLYEVDMRLRPDGSKGLLVSTLQAFENYQYQQAWTWEHQALVRARPLAGCQNLAARFVDVRHQVIQQTRNLAHLRTEVTSMRDKMRTNLLKKSPPQAHNNTNSDSTTEQLFHLKQGRGGMVDIEFIVQYLVLAYAHDYPQLSKYTDNIRILDTLESCHLLSAQHCQVLRDTYRSIRALQHQQALQNLSAQVHSDLLQNQCQQVQTIWQEVMQS